MDEQKYRRKTPQANVVLQELQTHLESPAVTDNEAPVRHCHRYPNNRPEQLNYQDAIKRDLPIGSGEIESAHLYNVQQRMKLPGAWRRERNAEHMLTFRLNRANQQWDGYWQQISKNSMINPPLQFESHPGEWTAWPALRQCRISSSARPYQLKVNAFNAAFTNPESLLI